MDEILTTFLVVWRETFEALLVIFLLSTRLAKENLWTLSKNYIALGILAGVLFSIFSAVALFKIDDMGDSAFAANLRWILPLAASFMMAHMVFWMAQHGKEISGEIKQLVENKKTKTFFWGIAGFIAYAVAREGFETVIFLYGLSLRAANQGQEFHFAWPALAGFGVSILTVWILKKGLSYFNLKYFFRVTNLFLIGTALSLFVVGVNALVDLEHLPAIKDPLWDSSGLISGSSFLGKTLNMLIGYTPQPSAMLVIGYGLFCVVMIAVYLKNRPTFRMAAT